LIRPSSKNSPRVGEGDDLPQTKGRFCAPHTFWTREKTRTKSMV